MAYPNRCRSGLEVVGCLTQMAGTDWEVVGIDFLVANRDGHCLVVGLGRTFVAGLAACRAALEGAAEAARLVQVAVRRGPGAAASLEAWAAFLREKSQGALVAFATHSMEEVVRIRSSSFFFFFNIFRSFFSFVLVNGFRFN